MVIIAVFGSASDRVVHRNAQETYEVNTRMEFISKVQELEGRVVNESLYLDYQVGDEWMNYNSALELLSA